MEIYILLCVIFFGGFGILWSKTTMPNIAIKLGLLIMAVWGLTKIWAWLIA